MSVRGRWVALGLALGAVAAGAAAGGVLWAFTAIERDAPVTAALGAPVRGQPTTVLVVGNDSRERLRAGGEERFGRTDTLTDHRADAVLLVQLPRGRDSTLKVLSLPRDVQVQVEGLGPQKLSWVLGYAGRAALVRTVSQLTGVSIQHYVELDFVGFAELVDAAGGVTLDFERAGRDRATGFEVEAGRHRLDGVAALAYARSRTYEELGDGEWVFLDDGDLGRIQRQQALVRSAITAAERGPRPSVLDRLRWLRRIGPHVTVDSRWSTFDLVRLADRLRTARPEQLHLSTLPTRPLVDHDARVSPFPPYHLGAIHYEVPAEPAASAALAAFAGRSEAK